MIMRRTTTVQGPDKTSYHGPLSGGRHVFKRMDWTVVEFKRSVTEHEAILTAICPISKSEV